MRYYLVICLLLPLFSHGQAPVPYLQDSTAAQHRQFLKYLPPPQAWVTDYEDIFTDKEEARLNAAAGRLRKPANAQFCIVSITRAAVTREEFDSFAMRLFNAWGIGTKEENNGVLILICKGHRRVRICNGRGIVPRLSDAATQQIIDEVALPSFKKGAYYTGALRSLNALAAKLSEK